MVVRARGSTLRFTLRFWWSACYGSVWTSWLGLAVRRVDEPEVKAKAEEHSAVLALRTTKPRTCHVSIGCRWTTPSRRIVARPRAEVAGRRRDANCCTSAHNAGAEVAGDPAAARRSSLLSLASPKGQPGDEVSLEQEVDDQGRDDREGCACRNQVVVAEELAL
jgi:hypothetical protein